MPWQEASIMSQRMELAALASSEGANVSELCRRFGVSRPTAYKWIERSRSGSVVAFDDRSRRPHSSPARTDDAMEARVVGVRRSHPVWGPRKIRAVLLGRGVEDVPAPSTITAILRRHGLIDQTRSHTHRPCTRFERPRPNELWQMDFKGHVPMHRGNGRCHPLTVIDDHSRFALGLRACGDETERTVRGELTSIFRVYGLPERILADNGPPWGVSNGGFAHTKLTAWLLRLGVGVCHGRPMHPQTQGKDERFHRTLKAELLSRTDLLDLADAQRKFSRWRSVYNLERPHEACAMQPPVSRYQPSTRPFPEQLPELCYGPDDEVRRVRRSGWVRFERREWHVGAAFAGARVGIGATPVDGIYEVRFGPYVVGIIDRTDTAAHNDG